jgi:hypothetical protein
MKVKNYVPGAPGSSQQTQTIRYLTSQVSVITNIQVARYAAHDGSYRARVTKYRDRDGSPLTGSAAPRPGGLRSLFTNLEPELQPGHGLAGQAQ